MQIRVPRSGSTTVTPVSVWLPVFVTTIWYSMMSPTALAMPSPAASTADTVLSVSSAGTWEKITVDGSLAVDEPDSFSAVTSTMLVTEPRSAVSKVTLKVQVIISPPAMGCGRSEKVKVDALSRVHTSVSASSVWWVSSKMPGLPVSLEIAGMVAAPPPLVIENWYGTVTG